MFSLLAQPLSNSHPIHSEVLREIDFGHAFGVRRDSYTGSEVHRLREGGACIGQVPGGFFDFVHVYDYTFGVYRRQQSSCIEVNNNGV